MKTPPLPTVPALAPPQGVTRILRHHPGVWIAALLVTLVLAAAGVAGVMAAAQVETDNRAVAAIGEATSGCIRQLQQNRLWGVSCCWFEGKPIIQQQKKAIGSWPETKAWSEKPCKVISLSSSSRQPDFLWHRSPEMHP